jgi:hypothetical protein
MLPVSGEQWKRRFSSYAKYAIMTNRGFKMRSSCIHEFDSIDDLRPHLKQGDQIVSLPIVTHYHSQKSARPEHRGGGGV